MEESEQKVYDIITDTINSLSEVLGHISKKVHKITAEESAISLKKAKEQFKLDQERKAKIKEAVKILDAEKKLVKEREIAEIERLAKIEKLKEIEKLKAEIKALS